MTEIVTQYLGLALTGLLLLVMVVAVGGSWFLNLFGLPGNWCILLIAVLYELFAPDGRFELSWTMIGILAGLAVLGEALEFAAGAVGVRRTGGSRRSAAFSLAGSLVGGILGAGMGLPIPIVGSVVGVLVFAGLGALVGAVLGEHTQGRELAGSLQVGAAAFVGRVCGSIGKSIVGAVMVAVFLTSLFL